MIFAKLFSFTAVCTMGVLPAFMLHAGEVMVENESWAAAFDTDSGALIKLENKPLHWNVEQHPGMGVSFRLNAPIEGRDNFITGQNQTGMFHFPVRFAQNCPVYTLF
ncbi:MAG TPA: hypothetical protein VMF08_13055 [Candidatus Sulfotelmatobacter sp.]|nr:hypothetical protein [Candidatus Sulfotelmatobacter sp.]